MTYRIIKSPSSSTLRILEQRLSIKLSDDTMERIGAIGLVQGKLIDMIFASDIAEKSADVTIGDIRGNCPQHMMLLAIFGDISSVETAIKSIKDKQNQLGMEML